MYFFMKSKEDAQKIKREERYLLANCPSARLPFWARGGDLRIVTYRVLQRTIKNGYLYETPCPFIYVGNKNKDLQAHIMNLFPCEHGQMYLNTPHLCSIQSHLINRVTSTTHCKFCSTLKNVELFAQGCIAK